MSIDPSILDMIQQHMGYSEEEIQLFKENPRNADIMVKSAELMRKTIIAEVVESHGCNSHHRIGDKIYFDGGGNLLTRLNPKKVCLYALNAFTPAVFAANELIYAGVDPNEMRFKRFGCFDVGVRCGGWGHIVMELKVEERSEIG
jgi:uncharacterized repeat protein (TIGR04076 family)